MISNLPHSIKMDISPFAYVDPYYHIQASWAVGQFYEQEMLTYIAANYHGGNFIDIGASVGNHTVFMAGLCAVKAVYAFEPVKQPFDKLQANVALNGLSGLVRAYNCALGSARKIGDMYMPSNGNEGMWRWTEDIKGSVQMNTLDSYGIQDVTLIKIDAEHCEPDIILGGMETIERSRPVIFVEADDKDLQFILHSLKDCHYVVGRCFNETATYELRC